MSSTFIISLRDVAIDFAFTGLPGETMLRLQVAKELTTNQIDYDDLVQMH